MQPSCAHCGASYNRYDNDFVYVGRFGAIGRQPRFDKEPCCYVHARDEYQLIEENEDLIGMIQHA